MVYAADTETIRGTTAKIRAWYRKLVEMNREPDEPCSKCRSTCWQPDDDIGHWYCFKCGNRGFWDNGEFTDVWRRDHVLGH